MKRAISVALAALMAVGFPGFALASEPAAATGALSLSTDPAGASVYVDGRPQGTTPVDLSTLSAGEHRVRVVKSGYLENSRLVSVRPGQVQQVRVKLTPHASMQVEDQPPRPEEKKGGGAKKAILIGLGVAVVGAGAFLLLAGGNDPPLAGTVSITPSGTGLQGATNFSFTAQGASDPNGDPLTFSWNLGDGSTASGQTVTKTYTTPGTFAVTVTVSDGEASATANGSVTVRNLAGQWTGTLAGSATTIVNFAQTGSALSGTVQFPTVALPNSTLAGTVSNPRAVSFTVNAPGFIPFTFTGTVDESLNRLSGTVNGSGFVNAPWTLQR